MITFVAIKPEKVIKQTGNTGASFIEYVVAAYGHDCIEVDSVEEIPTDKPVVLFSEQGTINIRDFDFPDDAYYVIGNDWEDIDPTKFSTTVRIPTVHPKRFKALYGSQAAAIIAWECYVRKL